MPPTQHKHRNKKRHSPNKKNRNEGQRKLPRNSPPIELQISHIGARGDGVGSANYRLDYQEKTVQIFVPETMVGEQVIAQPKTLNAQGIRAELVELKKASPERQIPPCPVFSQCGGCQLQHLSPETYQSWKKNQVQHALLDAGLEVNRPLATFWGTPETRRRITLSYRRTEKHLILGFLGRHSHFITQISPCKILHPALKKLLPEVQKWAETIFVKGDSGRIQVNLLDKGSDITLLPDAVIPIKHQSHIASTVAQTALSTYLVRLSILQPGDQEANPLLCPVIPNLSSFGLTIQPPPAVFLQASYEGEAQMIRLVAEHVGPNNSVIDLFCGAGTLSAGLLEKGIQLKAIDLDGPAITAFEQAAHRAGYGQNTAFERRNLFAAPLRVDELTGADIVIIDPPRQGAEAQMHHLKNASIQRIIMVSCNPRSFSRDLAILTEAGKYSLEQITLIDQFIYSTHIELVGELTLSSDGK